MRYVWVAIFTLYFIASADAAVRRADVIAEIDSLILSSGGRLDEPNLELFVESMESGETVKVGQEVFINGQSGSPLFLYLALVNSRGQLTLVDLSAEAGFNSKKLTTFKYPSAFRQPFYQTKPIGNVVVYVLASHSYSAINDLGLPVSGGTVVINQDIQMLKQTLGAFREAMGNEPIMSARTQYTVDHNDIQLGSRAIRKKLGGQVTQIDALESADSLSIQGITFESNSYSLTSQGVAQLMEVADALQKIKAEDRDAFGKIVLEGHTDNLGPDSYNQQLSEQRANAARSFLINQYGFESREIDSLGLGESSPIAPNTSSKTRSMNRRVDIRLTK